MLELQWSRRAFLKTGGALVVTFTLGEHAAEAQRTLAKSVEHDEVAAFLAIDAKGMVTLYSGKVELGTGVLTAITQIVAEELSVPFERVSTIQGDTLLTPNQGPTFASLSIQDGGMQIRRAAATARDALLDEAARKLGTAKSDLVVRDGVVSLRDGSKSLSYAELVGERKLALKVSPTARLKDPKDYTIVGKPIARLDIPAKIFGTFEFVQDVKVPGMLHARVVHPAGARATLLSFDDSPCRKIKGYLRAVRKGDLLAVVATNEWAAISASTAIVVKWSDWAGLPVESQLFEYVRNSKIARSEVFQSAGNTAEAMKAGGRKLQATYELAMNTHGSIGPSCAVADFKNGQLTVWTPSQSSHLLRQQLATMLQMKPDNVRCIYVEGAGCYGRNGSDDCSSEAALISQELGRPVRLQWMRQDEHGWDPKGPPVLLDYRASIDDQGPDRRVGSGRIHAGAADAALGRHAAGRRSREPAEVRTSRRAAAQHRARHSLFAPEQQADRALAGRNAAARGVDPCAGTHAEHLRQRELSRRDRRGRERRSVRDPEAIPHGCAGTRIAGAPAAVRPMGAAGQQATRRRRHSRAGGACPMRSTSSYAPTWAWWPM